MNKGWLILFVALISYGCASRAPIEIKQAPEKDLTIKEVQAEPDRFRGTTVRWGGVIAKVENKTTQTWIEIISYQLKKRGRPLLGNQSAGRFIASYDGFVDPLIYTEGREITVAGTISGKTDKSIGEFVYSYPIVTVTASHLWPENPAPPPYDYPPPWWYYDPWPYYHPYGYPYPPYYW